MTEYVTIVCDDVPEYDLVLHDIGPSPLEVVKVFSTMMSIGLWYAKQAVTAAPPAVLLEGIEGAVARRHAETLRAAGASVAVERRS
ncbi:ribosomal protein L7/L12 [Kitasatospora sp. NBC_01250]|uniref:ribosomal protein L7/L12 n=1 Tax=unclassified Kitasatospora TaxID=2633591 RepID=UPI002E157E7B|nr:MULTISPECIES: ribosomal protein L7/L12 [unclassified Kitasatospora]WSJ65173.1 ribosomal protein L7/L12 [Kitasatospora sp. NBC_01302]